LIRKRPRNDVGDEDIYTISRQNMSPLIAIQNGTSNSCRKRLNATCRMQNLGNSLGRIASQVTELKDMYKSHSNAEDLADKTRTAWELVAVMIQRVAAVVCAVLLAVVCTGIFLRLAFRTTQ
jgi:hypothetical protein